MLDHVRQRFPFHRIRQFNADARYDLERILIKKSAIINDVTSALRLVLLGIACFAVTAILALIFHTLILTIAECYYGNGCDQTPTLGTIAFSLDALSQLLYFAIFPLGTIMGRRDFRKVFANRMVRRIARITFAAIPVLLFPFKYLLMSGYQ